ncbi:MAG: hypothetical protein ACTSSH_12540, partial [Candidatus Heimdallarchaeota archaeon]
GGSNMTLKEASSVVDVIRTQIQPNAEIIWGTKVDHELGDLIRITVVISGVESNQLIGKQKKSTSLRGPPYDIVGGASSLSLGRPREKENLLRTEGHVTIRDLRDRLKEKQGSSLSQGSKRNKDDDTAEFWDELGISEGLD